MHMKPQDTMGKVQHFCINTKGLKRNRKCSTHLHFPLDMLGYLFFKLHLYRSEGDLPLMEKPGLCWQWSRLCWSFSGTLGKLRQVDWLSTTLGRNRVRGSMEIPETTDAWIWSNQQSAGGSQQLCGWKWMVVCRLAPASGQRGDSQ